MSISRRSAIQAAGVAVAAAGATAALAACGRGSEDSVATESTTVAGSGSPTPEVAPSKPEEVTQPAAGVVMTPGYARSVAQFAYMWGWPLVNMANRSASVTQAPEPILLNGILPAAPQGRLAMLSGYIDPGETFVTCPNQDVAYGLAYMSLDEQPVIAQVPDFGDRFFVYALYDARTDQFGEIGKQYGTKPGFYLLAGPNWDGEVPDGVEAVIRASTPLAAAVPRIFIDDTAEDRAAVQAVLNQVDIYPLEDFDGTMKTTDWAKLPHAGGPAQDGSGETKWIIPEQFFDQLGATLDSVAPLPGEEAMYAQFRELLNSAQSDEAVRAALVDAAVATERDVIDPFFLWAHNGVPTGNGWNRSTNGARFGVDYFNRTGTAKSNMFDNRQTETQYFYTDGDSSSQPLSGDRSYRVTFAAGQEPPIRGFWSLTLYNDKHLFHPNDLDRYSLGTKNKNLRRDEDGSLTIYVGSTSPGAQLESNWLPAPPGPFSLYIRAYWGQQPILDGSWQPPRIERV